MKKTFLIYFMSIFLCIAPTVAYGDSLPTQENTPSPTTNPLPTVTAESAILIDATTGEILFEKNSKEKMYPASITKLMTLLLAYENGTMTDTLTFSHDAVYSIEKGSSHIAMQEGEQITLEQALYGILLRSANEVSNAVAEYIDGNMETFTAHMTQRAKELGCLNTNFVNANGLYDENHYTTAYDMSLIAKELLKQDNYRAMMGNTYYEIPATNLQSEIRYLHGQHQMLNKNSTYYYEYATGGKPGFTSEAQNTLVTFAKKGDTELIAVVLKCKGADHYTDTKALFEYGFANYKTAKLFSATDYVQTLQVTETRNNNKTHELGTITAAPQTDIYTTLGINENATNFKVSVDCPQTISAPVSQGQIVGTLTVSSNSETVTTVNLLANKAVATTSPEAQAALEKEQRSKIIKLAIKIIGAVFLAFCVLLCITRFIGNYKRKQRRKQRAARRRQQR